MASKPLLNNIPLHCNICPKKPDFSDISHLLTHIASKGHLSHYYKTKVRSSNEEASRILIDEYDAWYAACNIEDLMSDRLDQKDRRNSRTRNSTNSGSLLCDVTSLHFTLLHLIRACLSQHLLRAWHNQSLTTAKLTHATCSDASTIQSTHYCWSFTFQPVHRQST